MIKIVKPFDLGFGGWLSRFRLDWNPHDVMGCHIFWAGFIRVGSGFKRSMKSSKSMAQKGAKSSSSSSPGSGMSFFGWIFSWLFLLIRSIPVFILMVPSLAVLLMIYNPYVTVNIALFVDFYSPWILFESKFFDQYHDYLISTLEEREEQPLIEIIRHPSSILYLKQYRILTEFGQG